MRRLLANAALFEDPRAYEAGVLDAIESLRRIAPEGDHAVDAESQPTAGAGR